MEVLVTGADGDLGREVADGFRSAGHQVLMLAPNAGDAQTSTIACDPADPVSLAAVQPLLPHHLDAVVCVPGPPPAAVTEGSVTPADTAVTWRSAFERTVLSAVLMVQTVGDQLRSGGSIVAVAPVPDEAADAAAQAALSNWVAAQADHFGIRGIAINAVAYGGAAPACYEGLPTPPMPPSTEIARLSLFLTTPAARRITGQTLYVGRGAAVSYG